MGAFKLQSRIQEIIGGAIGLAVLIFIIAVFASAPSPIGTIFTGLLNEILIGIALIVFIILLIVILKLFQVI